MIISANKNFNIKIDNQCGKSLINIDIKNHIII